jgi:hypothetical protein
MAEDQKRPKRPRDVIDNAVRVMQVATGQREEAFEEIARDPGKEYARKGDKKGEGASCQANARAS